MVRTILRGVCVCTCGRVVLDPWLRVCSAVRQCTRGKRVSPPLAGADNRVFPRATVWHGGVGFGTVCFGGVPVGFVGFVRARSACTFCALLAWRRRAGTLARARSATQAGKAMLRLGLHATRACAPFRPLSRPVAPGPLELIAVARHDTLPPRRVFKLSLSPQCPRPHPHPLRATYDAQTTYFCYSHNEYNSSGMRMTVFHMVAHY